MSETETPDLEGLAQRIEKMRAAPDDQCFSAAKRLGIQQGRLDDWWVSWSPSNFNSVAEGTWNHWQWLAAIILGWVDEEDRPYDEDKPLPDFASALRWAAAEIARERARADAAEALLNGMAHGCRAGRDGECNWDGCPQKADWLSHCPYDIACGDPGCDASANVSRALAAKIRERGE